MNSILTSVFTSGFMGKLFFVFFLYFSALMIYYLVLGLIGLFEGEKREREHEIEDYFSFSVSTFTVPVSLIIPAHNEEAWIKDTVQAVLNLDYPEFELIVINDGSTDHTMDILSSVLELELLDNPYVDHFNSGKVYGVFKSRKYPCVTVLSKASGQKKAGAVNAGLNFAKYKYVCVIDGDTVLEPDALLKVMVHVQRDPDSVIGIGSYFGLLNGFKVKDGKILERRFSYHPIIAYQNLEYIRSFIGNRIAWSRLNATPIVSGGFGVWRRDILMEVGGFSSEFSSEDLEFTFRIQDYIIKNNKKNYKIMMLPYYVGWTFGPGDIRSLISQRNRWQRVTNEAVECYKHVIFNPRYGAFGLFTIPYFLFYEMLGIFFEFSSLTVAALGIIFGFITYKIFITFFCFMILTQGLISLIYLWIFIRCQDIWKIKEIAYLSFMCLTELFWYRWIIMLAKLCGTWGYLRGVRTYDQFFRVKTSEAK